MKVHVIADEIYRELGSPDDISVPSVSFWIRGHIGDLNVLLNTDFEIDDDTISVDPELTEEEKSILKKLFNVYYYQKKSMSFLGAASFDTMLEVSSDGATVRTVNKNEVAKTYLSLKRNEDEALVRLVNSYKNNNAKPQHIAGDDTVNGLTYEKEQLRE